jgi:hypothetical protein
MSKVKFVNSDGRTFFECHPAEARAAVIAVKGIREGKISLPDMGGTVTLLNLLGMNRRRLVFTDNLLDAIRRTFSIIEQQESGAIATHVICGPDVYADIRMLAKDYLIDLGAKSILDENAWSLIDTAKIYVVKDCDFNEVSSIPNGGVVIVGSGKNILEPIYELVPQTTN